MLFGGYASNLGGNLDDTWEYDGTTWTKIMPALSPGPRSSAMMAYAARASTTIAPWITASRQSMTTVNTATSLS